MQPLKLKKGATGAYVSLLAGVLIFMFLLKQCSTPTNPFGNTGTLAGGDTLNVAIDYSPMSMYMIDDTLGGFNYDLLRQVAAANNLKLKFHPINSLERAMQLLDSGYCDIVVADIPMTADSRKRFLFTEPTFLDRSILVQRRDSADRKKVNGVLDLAGRVVTVVAGTPVASRIINLGREIGDTIYVTSDSTYSAEQLIMLVAGGEIDLAVVNEGIARRVSEKIPEVDISTNISFSQFQSWIVGHSNAALRDSINSMLIRYKNTQDYELLLKRYNVIRPPRQEIPKPN